MTRPPRRRSPLARSMHDFVEGPPSARRAMRVITLATISTTLVAGTAVWLFDRRDFPTFGDALWWALQTVTTVGYGDVTPKHAVGRIIGGVVLMYAVAFLSILFFVFYYLCLAGGEELADRRLLVPWIAMWTPNLVIGGIGLILTLQAAEVIRRPRRKPRRPSRRPAVA